MTLQKYTWYLVRLAIIALTILALSWAFLAFGKTYEIEGSTTPFPAPKFALDAPEPENALLYVQRQAIANGVNPRIAAYIVEHESGGQINPKPHHNKNGSIDYGLWQMNSYNDNFSLDCALSMECSTTQALKWIKAGQLWRWVAWNDRCSYPQFTPPNCP